MKKAIPIHIAVEDVLSEAVVRKLLLEGDNSFAIGICYQKGGFGYLKRAIDGFNRAARFTPHLVLTDLDRAECAPSLIASWLATPQHPNLLFRVAVRQVESWVMADRAEFSKYLGIPASTVPRSLENEANAKRKLLQLARKSPLADLRSDLLPRTGSSAVQGPNYNGRLIYFVRNIWSAKRAAINSQSLAQIHG